MARHTATARRTGKDAWPSEARTRSDDRTRTVNENRSSARMTRSRTIDDVTSLADAIGKGGDDLLRSAGAELGGLGTSDHGHGWAVMDRDIDQ